MRILNLGGYEELRDWDTIKFDASTFPGGESHIRLHVDEPKRFLNGESGVVRILARLTSGNAVMQLAVAVDALRRAGYKSISCSMPYIPYGQQDRVCNPGESLSVKVFTNIINGMGFDEVEVFDPHSDVGPALIDNCVVQTNFELVKAAILGFDRVNLICPDQGAQKKIYGVVAELFDKEFGSFQDDHFNLVKCDKERDLATTKIKTIHVPRIDNDWPCLLVDDLCLGGGTFIGIVDKMREQGNNNEVRLCVSHGIFNAGFDRLSSRFTDIVTTTSIREVGEDNCFPLTFVKRLPYFKQSSWEKV